MNAVKPPTTTDGFCSASVQIGQDKYDAGEPIRLNKFLAERIGVSRRQADELIAHGQISVNGQTAVIGQPIDKNDNVCYNGKDIPFTTAYTYLALNKPPSYVSSRRQQGKIPTLYALLPKKYQQLKTVGRLDQDSSGLILLTNDGDFSFQMTHPRFYKEKRYYVQLDHPLAPLHQQMIADLGINLPDGPSRLGLAVIDDILLLQDLAIHPHELGAMRALAQKSSRYFWQVIMHEGRNRQIRRTFSALGYMVVKLHRVQFGPYSLDGLALGDFVEVENSLRMR